MALITDDEIIRTRQNEIVAECFEIDDSIQQKLKEIEELKALKIRRTNEWSIMDAHRDRGHVRVVTTTTVMEVSYKKGGDRLKVEDQLKMIFNAVGRPMAINEIISQLETYGTMWSKYISAYGYITKCDCLEKIPQTRGMFQLRRNRG